MAYSEDYRNAAIDYKKSGRTFKELKAAFKITPRTYYQWIERLRKSGSVKAAIRQPRDREIGLDALKKALEEKPDAYLRELAQPFNCLAAAVHKRLVQFGIT
jgi:transposase